MRQYRYRTGVLVGPWREAPGRAAADAVRSGQARVDAGGGSLTWLVPGKIEAVDGEAEAERRS